MSYKLYDAEIEYLYSSGAGQYINTLIPYDSTIVVEGSVQLAGSATGNYMFGIYTTVGGSARRWAVNCATTTSVLAHFGTVTNVSAAFSRNIFHSIRADYRYFSVDGKVTNTNAAAFTPERDVNIFLFARSNNNNADSFRAVFIGDFKIYKGDALVRNFIPVRVGNVGYLFDKVSMKLFGNSGTGSFVLGPDVAPAAYANEIAFLESTGSQYIDTGVVGSSDLSVVLKCYYPASSASFYKGSILGSRAANNDNQYMILHTYMENFRYGNHSSNSWENPTDKVLIFDNTESHNILKVFDTDNNLVTTLTATAETFNNNLNIVLFGINDNGNILKASNRIYSLKMYEGTTLVRDYIPVEYNDIGYLYDKVSGKFFANQGTGKFALGHRAPRFDGKACARSYTRREIIAASRRRLPTGYSEVEYIVNPSTAYLDLGVRAKSGTRLIVDFMFTQVTTTSSRPFIQNADANYGYENKTVIFVFATFSGSFRYSYGVKNNGLITTTTLFKFALNTRYVLDFGYNGLYVNGTLYNSMAAAHEGWVTAGGQTTANVKIFNTGGTHRGRLYSYKLYENETLLQDAVPCINSEGVAGVYNLVDKTFKSSASATAFTAGKIIY